MPAQDDPTASEHAPDATPLEDEELKGLRQSWITTRDDLNEAEYDNVLAALNKWYGRKRRLHQLLDDKLLRDLHRDMFGEVWTWAGTYRLTEKSNGIDPTQISVAVRNLVDDAQFWLAPESAMDIDEAAMRFHHKLVLIHPFANGNGRHSRLITDLVLRSVGAPEFTWGSSANLGSAGEVRTRYIESLRAADLGDYTALKVFVRT